MSFKSKSSPWRWIILFLGIGLIAFRLYLPTLVKNYLVRAINHTPGYKGDIQSVHLALWRGAYSIYGLHLEKTNGKVPIPFIQIPKIYFSMAWGPLFHGNLSGKVELDEPQVNFVASKSKETSQLSIDKELENSAKAIIPIRIARFGIKDGEVHFRNYEAIPPVDIYLHRVFVLATNLTNSRRLSQTLKATIDAHAVAMSSGTVTLHAAADPLDPKPTFDFSFKLENLLLPELNSFFRHYLAVEAKTGSLDFYMEGAAKQGVFKGYAKPLLEKVDLLHTKEDASMGEVIKAFAVKVVSYTLKNHPKDRLGSRIDIEGTVDKPNPNIWSAISSFLHNWVVTALTKGFEGSKS